MFNPKTAEGQKTPTRIIARRRPQQFVALDSSTPPHRADISGSHPQHPLPKRRAGVAKFLVGLVPDALIGTEPHGRAVRETLTRRIEDFDPLGFAFVLTVFINLLAIAALLDGAN